jgi:hypothetical protein
MNSNFGNGFKVEPVQFVENVDLPQDTANLETQTEQVVLQDEIKPRRGWNFGAFTFPLLWCLFNGCMWQFVIVLIPGVNQIFRFFLGGFGNRWAWKVYGEDRMGEVERFNKKQKRWNIAGIIVLSIIAIIGIIGIISSFS